jgi:lactobin A/cerein 7B family class IIb bacteriocin
MEKNMRELNKFELKKVQGGVLPLIAAAAGAYVGVKVAKWIKKTFL